MSKKDPIPPKSAAEYAAEAIEYYANARALLRSVPIRDERYTNVKRVREACGTGYLAVLAAVRGWLLSQGMPADKLPEEYKAYAQARSRYGARNGKVTSAFHHGYNALHLDGYYRGFSDVGFGRQAFPQVRFLIERLTGRKVEPA